MTIAIYGAGGFGRNIASAFLDSLSGYVLLDDNPDVPSRVGGRELLDDKEFLSKHRFIVPIGDNRARRTICETIARNEGSFCPFQDKSSVISRVSRIGRAHIVMPFSFIGAHAMVGDYVVVNTHATVEHNCIIGDGANLCDHVVLGGGSIIGENSFLGLGAIVLPKVKIGNNVVVGAGTVVINDVPDNVTIVGNPARVIEGHNGT